MFKKVLLNKKLVLYYFHQIVYFKKISFLSNCMDSSIKQAISPVIAVILLLGITTVISVGVFNFTQEYFDQSQDQIDTGNILFQELKKKVIYSTINETYLQLPYHGIRISNVYLEGNECFGNSGYYNQSKIIIDLSDCSNGITTSKPKLTLYNIDESVLEYTLDFEKAVFDVDGINPRFNFMMDVNLSTASFSFLGAPEEAIGLGDISISGDVNGDGVDDILIGSRLNSEGGNSSGKLYLFFGNNKGWELDQTLAEADASFIGENAQDQLTFTVNIVGDVNNDSFDDILVSSVYNDEGGAWAGQVYLILGKATGWVTDINISAAANASFIGEGASRYLGFSMGGGRHDFNNDGYDDFVIGARGANIIGSAGQTYIVFGRSTGWAMDQDIGTFSNGSLIGDYALDRHPAVAGAQDLNNDGYDDILIAAWPDATGKPGGRLNILFGQDGNWPKDVNVSLVKNASYFGGYSDDWLFGVAGLGDVNGDGLGDLFVEASGSDDGGNDSGKAYVLFGRETGWVQDGNLSDYANASFVGEHSFDYFRTVPSVGAGDINNDGFNDLLFVASGNDENGNASGQVYLYFGNTTGWPVNQNISDVADASFIGEGKDQGFFGGIYIVTSGGDINGDGFNDILMGAERNNEGGNDAGQVYAILS